MVDPTGGNPVSKLREDSLDHAVEGSPLLFHETSPLNELSLERTLTGLKLVSDLIEIRPIALEERGLPVQSLKLLDPRPIKSVSGERTIYLRANA